MPNIFDDSIQFTETTLAILGTTSNSPGPNFRTSNFLSGSDKNTNISYLVKTIDRKYVAISVKGEKYICFIDKNNKAEFTKKLFKGEKIPIKVIELYDFRSMKFSQSCVLRAYLDEANNIRDLDMVKT